jgi:urease accessory protein
MRRASHWLAITVAAGICLAGARTAFAHPGHVGDHGSLVSGVVHPLTGLDHLLAMLASGLLAVRVGTRRALWLIPASFVGLMLVGGGLALAGLPLPQAEWGVSLSVIVLGLMVAMLPSVPLGIAAACVGVFAVCHGHAHVAELGGQAVVPFILGFTASTLMLHLAAIGGGVLAVRAQRPRLVRLAGAGIAAAFAFVLVAT